MENKKRTDVEECVIKHKGNFYLKTEIGFKKIILTTDQDLIKNGVQEINNEFLEWFVKNPSCEYIKISEYKTPSGIFYHKDNIPYSYYEVIIPKEENLEKVNLTEITGKKIVNYLDKYKGQSIYNDIALAIEFGYQLKLEEDESK